MARKFEITEAHSGAAFAVTVITRTSGVEVAGVKDDGVLKIRLTESHTDGAADKQLLQFLAQKLQVPIEKIEIVAGANEKDKMISVEGIRPQDVESRLLPDQ